MFDVLHYPKFYHYRKGVSDKGWVFHRLSCIPENMQLEVSREYEHLFLVKGRKAANTYLNNVAREQQEIHCGAGQS